MPEDQFKQTTLWKSSLAERPNDDFAEPRNTLRSEYLNFRTKVTQLVTQIGTALPNLTLHDITHLDALWETASLVTGPEYPLNPLEGFVLGGAILLHDAALCFEAYEGGVNGLHETVAWKDTYAHLGRTSSNMPEVEKIKNSDFLALRQLHAEQAGVLLERHWVVPVTNQPIFLLENSELRNSLGSLIGKIASSHHWNIEEVGSGFRSQVNAPANFPREWRVDPIKIACILRCADALHINAQRAPDFLHALIQRRGISLDHWQAQNWLGHVDLDQSDPDEKTLLATSIRSFPEAQAAAWWVAFDAVCLADKEIRDANALLKAKKSPPFKVHGIKGVESPERMSDFITADGWNPCSVSIHISNVEKLVSTLGGEQLYVGQNDLFGVSIREALQNSRDAIQARYHLDNNYMGQIFIRLQKQEDEIILFIEDDGVGMSKRVLTGPLLDFGTSFWASSLVKSELPNLISSNYQSVGKFGIGFYSLFMISKKIKVTSRRWDGGLNDCNQLIFENGISLRPILKSGSISGFPSGCSTMIELHLKEDIVNSDLTINTNPKARPEDSLVVNLPDYISALVIGLDVPVFFQNFDGNKVCLHKPEYSDINHRENWLKRISFSEYSNDSIADEYIRKNHQRLRFIEENGIRYGLAAISTLYRRENFFAAATIGGLSLNTYPKSSRHFIGNIEYKPNSVRRDQGEFAASSSAMKEWAKEQAEILKSSTLNLRESLFTPYSLVEFDIDPIEFAKILVVKNKERLVVSFSELIDMSTDSQIMLLKMNFADHLEIHHSIEYMDGSILVLPVDNGSFNATVFEQNIPKHNFSIIDCINRTAITKNYNTSWEVVRGIGKGYFGVLDVITAKLEHQ
jgi:hypothetical protein